MSDFHVPDGWYEPPESHECPTAPDCTCEEDAQDAYDDAMADRAEARREAGEDW